MSSANSSPVNHRYILNNIPMISSWYPQYVPNLPSTCALCAFFRSSPCPGDKAVAQLLLRVLQPKLVRSSVAPDISRCKSWSLGWILVDTIWVEDELVEWCWMSQDLGLNISSINLDDALCRNGFGSPETECSPRPVLHPAGVEHRWLHSSWATVHGALLGPVEDAL